MQDTRTPSGVVCIGTSIVGSTAASLVHEAEDVCVECRTVQRTIECAGQIRILPMGSITGFIPVIERPVCVDVVCPIVGSLHSRDLFGSFAEKLRDPPIGAIIGATVNTSGRIGPDSILECSESVGPITSGSGRNHFPVNGAFECEVNLVVRSMATSRTAGHLSQWKNREITEIEAVRSNTIVQCYIGHAVIDSVVREGLIEADGIYTRSPGVVLVNVDVPRKQIVVLKPEELGDCSVCGVIRWVGGGESKGAVNGFVGKEVDVCQHIDECEISIGSLT